MESSFSIVAEPNRRAILRLLLSSERSVGELERELSGVEDSATSRTAAPPRRVEDEIGDVLFAVATLARRLNVDPETALRGATRRFATRFERLRTEAGEEGLSVLSDEELSARFRAAR